MNMHIGFCGLLSTVFITLKLLNIISWSWAWVLSPIWIPIVAASMLIVILAAIIFVIETIGDKSV